MPLRLSLVSIRRGDGTLVHEAAPVAEVHVDAGGRRASYVRGAVANERYDVTAAGVELSFAFQHPLPGRGDLVVRMHIESALAAPPGPADTVEYASAHGGVVFGPITGVDATGRRAAGHYVVDGDGLELCLPCEFVDAAHYPLLLDPLIGPSVTISANEDALAPDGAFDAASGIYLAAFQVRYSQLDADVFAARLDGNGNSLGVLVVAGTPLLEMAPAVANVRGSARFLVAWQQAGAPFGPWDVHGRSVSPLGVQSTAVPLVATANNDFEPQLAGEAVAGQQALLVFREQGAGIGVVAVDVPASADPAASTIAMVTTESSAEHVTIGRSGGTAGRTVVAWLENVVGPQFAARAVDRAGNVLGAIELVGPVEFLRSQCELSVDGDGTDFLLVYDRIEGGGPQKNVFVQKLRWDGAALQEVGLPGALAIGPSDERQPQVAFLGRKYLLTWLVDVSSTATRLTHATLSQDCQPCGTTGAVGTGGIGERDAAPAIASRWAADAASDEALILYGEFDLAPPFVGNVQARPFDAMAGGPETTVGPGCGNGGTAGTNGPFALGNPDFAFTLTGADPQAPIAAISLAHGGTPFVCGGCQLLPHLALVIAIPTAGSASYPLAVPCAAGLLGLPIEFQWLVFGPTGAVCPLIPGLSASDWRRVVVAH
jgi:hypothetical protein